MIEDVLMKENVIIYKRFCIRHDQSAYTDFKQSLAPQIGHPVELDNLATNGGGKYFDALLLHSEKPS